MPSIKNWIKKQTILWGLLLSTAPLVGRTEMPSLYEVEVPLPAQREKADQSLLLQEAFKKVLVRLHGSEQILEIPKIQENLTRFDRFIVQFAYRDQAIKVKFNEKQLQPFLEEAYQTASVSPAALPAIWGYPRPSTLIWLVSQTEKETVFEGAEGERGVEMAQVLNERGLPFLFPLFDLADTQGISETDLLSSKYEAIQKASVRYQPEFILIGILKEDSRDSEWVLLKNDEISKWEFKNRPPQRAFKSVAESLRKALVRASAPALSSQISGQASIVPKAFVLNVKGLVDASLYSNILTYLKRLPGVKSVEVSELSPQNTVFILNSTQNGASLAKSIRQNALLREGADFNETSNLSYEIVKGSEPSE